MGEEFIGDAIKNSVEKIVREKIEEEIDKKVKQFKRELEYRKDNYIAEVMKGIRIFHERDFGSLGINYRIIFENITKIEK